MTRALFALLGALALSSTTAAQETPFTPAKGMAKFKVMLGNWEGSGNAWMEAGTEPGAWTAVSTTSEILNGHVVQEDTRIEFGPGMPPLEFRTFYGWDAAADQPVVYGVSNKGDGWEGTIRWADDHTIVGSTHHVENGAPLAERSFTRFAKDSYSFQVDRAKGTAPFFTHVEGSFRRSQKSFDARAAEASVHFVPPGSEGTALKELARFEPMIGNYELSGKVAMTPGAPMTDITGREQVEWMFGKSVLAYHGASDPHEGFAWEGYGYQWWDPVKRCFVHLHVNNMGEIGTSEGRWLDERKLAFTRMGVRQGTPSVERTMLELSEQGRIARVYSDAIQGAGAPARGFEATYTLKDAGTATAALAFKPGSCCDRAGKAGKACPHPCCVEATKAGKVCASCN